MMMIYLKTVIDCLDKEFQKELCMEPFIPRDTSVKASKILFASIKKRSASEKLLLTTQLSDSLMAISKQGIRNRHPEYTEQQVTQAYLKIILSRFLYKKIFQGTVIKP